MEKIRLLPDERLHKAAVARRHLPDAVRAEVPEQFFDGGVQLLPEALCLQTAAEEHIAPVIADAPLPAQAVGVIAVLPLGAGEHGVVVPVEDVPPLAVQRAVEIHVPALGVGVAQQDLERHPVGDVLGVEGRFEEVFHRGGLVVQHVQHLDELLVVVAALDLQKLLKGRFVIGRVGLEPDHIPIAQELEEVYLIKLAVLIQPVRPEGVLLSCSTWVYSP